MNIVIVELFIFNHVFYVLSRRLNFTQPIKENLASELNYQNYLRDMSVRPKDIFYPSEEYYVENVPRNLQQLNRDNRNLRLDYRSLCETVSEKVEIKDQDYEYQPSQYYEVYCKGYSLLSEEERIIKPLEQKCIYPAFHCVQKIRRMSFVRRPWNSDSDCWESYTKDIASGCDCMWPVSNLGEISHHY
ncbi:hypothetical protein PUN28_007551 [Cardiocondyla obscurior]|uniref:Prothoracicotropic hormone n=1 Tax=Cardiocondyla obscurior TaxID=286306 RepID=A0AAW2G5L1_9HYME